MLLNDFFSILDSESSETALSVTVRLNPEHVIFKAHFPGYPIMPGVCQLQMATEILSWHSGLELCLSDIKNAKYTAALIPGETVDMAVRFKKIIIEGNTCKASVTFEGEGKVFSKMSMTCHVVRSDSDI